jgi:hypothetical protein
MPHASWCQTAHVSEFRYAPGWLTGAVSEVGFASIRCEDRTLEVSVSGGMEELLDGCAAGLPRTELVALDPNQAQQFRDCVWGKCAALYT